MQLKLNISPCPNDTFAFDALVNNRIAHPEVEIETTYADIEELNAMAIRGDGDICKISYAILPLIHDNYRLLDCGSALGCGNGPLLVRRKNDATKIESVAIPGIHTTANLLMTKLFGQYTNKQELLFSEIAEAVENGQFSAGVLIHEGRFVYEKRNLELVADLGLEWQKATSLPLPLGAIVIRRDLPLATQQAVEQAIGKSIDYAWANPTASRQYIAQHAQELDPEVIEAHIKLFVNNFTRSLGSEGRRAVEALTSIKID